MRRQTKRRIAYAAFWVTFLVTYAIGDNMIPMSNNTWQLQLIPDFAALACASFAMLVVALFFTRISKQQRQGHGGSRAHSGG